MTPLLKINIPGHLIGQTLAPRAAGGFYRPKNYRECLRKCKLFVKLAIARSPIACDFPIKGKVIVNISGRRFGGYDQDKFMGTVYDALQFGGAVKNDRQCKLGAFTVTNDLTKLDKHEKEYTEVEIYLLP